jgi:hypothetical protein
MAKIEKIIEEEVVNDGIELNSPMDLIKDLPLVVKLPEDASKAQKAYAKVINSYAYQNPAKFELKKDIMLAKLRSLKNAPDPIEHSNLRINNSGI